MGGEPPKGWRQTTLQAECDLLVGFAFKSRDFTEEPADVKLLRGDNVAQGQLRWDGVRRVSASLASRHSQYALKAGDVVLAMDRPWIEAGLKWAVVQVDDMPCRLVQRVACLRSGPEMDQAFLACLIADPRFTQHIRLAQTGTAVPHISSRQIGAYSLTLPPVVEQSTIARTIGAFNERIASNQQMAEGLVRIVETVGAQAVRQADRRLPIDVLAQQIRDPGDSALPYLGLDDMPRGSTVLKDWKTENTPTGATWAFRPMDILFGKLRPYFKKVGVAAIEGRCTREVLVLRPVEPRYFGLLAAVVPSQGFVDYCVARSTGTRMPRSEWNVVSSYEIGVPADDVLENLDEVARTSYRQVSGLIAEGRTLGAIRDTLLPKLVSGQIRVPLSRDPEEQVGAAVEALG